MHGRVVQLQLGERIAQRFELVGLHRIQAGEHLRLDLLEPGQCMGRRSTRVGHRVAHPGVSQVLDSGHHEAHFAGAQQLARLCLGSKNPDLLAQVSGAGGHQQHLVLGLEYAVDHPHQHHDADVVVEPRIDDQGGESLARVAAGCRDALDDSLEDFIDPLAGLGAGQDRFVRVDPDHILDLGPRLLRIGLRQVHLVQHG